MTTWLLPLFVAAIAVLYSSVGHGGATGYIAVMGLLGFPVEEIRPAALLLNVAVAAIGTIQFVRAGHFRRDLVVPLACGSVPAAAVGGGVVLPTAVLELLLGIVLALSAVRILVAARPGLRAADHGGGEHESPGHRPSTPILIGLGILLGFLSGLTGVGGGVFLTPLLLLWGVGSTRQVAAVSVAFILVNSLAGLAGWLGAGRSLPSVAAGVVVAAVTGGLVGSQAGAFRLPVSWLRLLMAAVLAVASLKLLNRGAEAVRQEVYGVTSLPAAEVRPRQVPMSMVSL
jgi:uncharacterized protein